jgi:hypothetical protein
MIVQQTIQQRIADLQTAAATAIPEVTTLPKLLKSHNVCYKEGDNAKAWYNRVKDVCAQRPQVKKHFRRLLLEQNAPTLKVLINAPDLFEDDPPNNKDQVDHIDNNDDNHPDCEIQVNLLNVLPKDTFTHFNDGMIQRDVTTFPSYDNNHQIVEDNLTTDPGFFILSTSDDVTPSSMDTIDLYPTDFEHDKRDLIDMASTHCCPIHPLAYLTQIPSSSSFPTNPLLQIHWVQTSLISILYHFNLIHPR